MSADAAILTAMGTLLVGSGLASGSETAIFRLDSRDLEAIDRANPARAARLRAHLASPQRLLIIVLLLNMTVNVAYFALSAQLALRQESTAAASLVSIASLFTIILIGEILAKLLAGAARRTFAPLILVPITAIGSALSPIIWVIDHLILRPISRLLMPAGAPRATVSQSEMERILETGVERGDLAGAEQRLIIGVLALRQFRLRDIVTPRHEMIVIEREDLGSIERLGQIRASAAQSTLHIFPVFENGIDGELLGVLTLDALLDHTVSPDAAIAPPLILPEPVVLEQALARLDERDATAALCVDEHGAYTGVVSRREIIEAVTAASQPPDASGDVDQVAPGVWQVPGSLSVRAWSRFIPELAPGASPRISTLAGLVMTLLGRLPAEGDTARVANLAIKVLAVRGRSAERLEIRVLPRGARP